MSTQKNLDNRSEEELRKEKLRFEIQHLNAPWYKKPSFLVPIIIGFITIISAQLTGVFDVRIEKLD